LVAQPAKKQKSKTNTNSVSLLLIGPTTSQKFLFENRTNIHYKIGLFHTVMKKIMSEQEYCRHCHERHECQEIYRQLGKAKGPSVVFKVVAAFLVPLVVFIGSLTVFEWILGKMVNPGALKTGISLVLALLVTVVCILVIKMSRGHQRKHKLQ